MITSRIVPRQRDLGDGFLVSRALPSGPVRNVGPFVFFDSFGPTSLPPGRGLDVRPHPHIGLATVTYLFEGEILHRDSLGTEALIRPGEVNWMTAGRGIVHSERSPAGQRARGVRIHGVQTWIALPLAHEEAEPAFAHHDRLPEAESHGLAMRIILGSLGDLRSPVATLSETFYADAQFDAGADFTWPPHVEERAIYVIAGSLAVAGERADAGTMLVFTPGTSITLSSLEPSRVMLVGGAPLDAPRFVWWNFVSSRKERIREAAQAWQARAFPPVPGETEFIPLPERSPGVVDYP